MSQDNIGKRISYVDPKRMSLSSVARALIKAGYVLEAEAGHVLEADVEAYGKGGKVLSKIKESTIYKLLDNPRVMGVELGHESIIELISLLQNSGLLSKGGRVE